MRGLASIASAILVVAGAGPLLADPKPDEIARCAAFYHVELDAPAEDGPFYLTVSGGPLVYAFYGEAYLAFDRDQSALNDRIDKLVPYYRDLKSKRPLPKPDGIAQSEVDWWDVERSRCEALGASLDQTHRFFWVRIGSDTTPFPFPGADPSDIDIVNYGIGWYGASCIGYKLSLQRVQRDLNTSLGLAEKKVSAAAELTTLLQQGTGWQDDYLLLHLHDRETQFAAAARVILPLNAVQQPLPYPELEILRSGQSDCQNYQMYLNQRAVLVAKGSPP